MTAPAACHECRDLLGGYVLHALEQVEDEAVRTHLATCAACAAEHAQLAAIPTILDTAGPGATEGATEQPPAALEEAVLDRFAREHPRDRSAAVREDGRRSGAREPSGRSVTHEGDDRPDSRARRLRTTLRARFARPLPAALAGALAAAAVSAALIVLPGGTGSDSPAGESYQASLLGSPAAPGARASAELKVFASGTHVRLSVRGLHGSPDTVYELWCLRDDGEKVSAGTFRTDASGRADVDLTTAAIPGEYHRLGVERRSLSPGGPPGTSVMTGEIQYSHS